MNQSPMGEMLSVRKLALAALLTCFFSAATCVQAASKSGVLANELRSPLGVSAAPRSNEPKPQHAKQHAEVDKELALEEARCYQQFAVNGCLSDARAHARAERAVLDERARNERAAERQASSEAKRRERALRHTDADKPPGGASGSTAATATTGAGNNGTRAQPRALEPKAKRSPRAAPVPREANAVRGREDRVAAQVQRDARAERARSRLAEKRAAAERRQASIKQRQQVREAQGRAAPAPLPAAIPQRIL